MYLRKITLQNIKSIQSLTWALPPGAQRPGWHVLIGDNAAGKSTVLRAVAMALLGPREMLGLRTDLSAYLMKGEDSGEIGLEVEFDGMDRFSRAGARPKSTSLGFGLRLRRVESRYEIEPTVEAASEHVWGTGAGWFSASFGPMRRFSGGDKEYERLFLTHPRLAAHLSIFGEDVALTEIERWLSRLRLQQLENSNTHHLLDDLKRFINQPGLLPHGTRWEEVSSEGIFFRDGRGHRVKMDQLSDGFRSILCLAFELIRQMEIAYPGAALMTPGPEGVTIEAPGLVLVDEIDAHLHPSWQQEVGFWFTRFFPGIQFLITTHSPLVCRAAEQGSIFKLASPGEDQAAGFIEGEPRLRLLRGDVQIAYSTRAFGDITTSPVARDLSARLARLSALEFERELDEDERRQVQELKQALPLPQSIFVEQRAAFETLEQLLDPTKRSE